MTTWTYLGQAPGADTATVSIWRRDDTGERIAWKSTKTTRGILGAVYDVTDYDGEHWPRPVFSGRMADDAAQIQLEARGQQQVIERQRAERAARRNPEYQPLLAQAGQLAAGLSWSARQALVEELTRAVHQAATRRS